MSGIDTLENEQNLSCLKLKPVLCDCVCYHHWFDTFGRLFTKTVHDNNTIKATGITFLSHAQETGCLLGGLRHQLSVCLYCSHQI